MSEQRLNATLNPERILLFDSCCVCKSANRLDCTFHSTDRFSIESKCPMKGRADEPGDNACECHTGVNISGVYQQQSATHEAALSNTGTWASYGLSSILCNRCQWSGRMQRSTSHCPVLLKHHMTECSHGCSRISNLIRFSDKKHWDTHAGRHTCWL